MLRFPDWLLSRDWKTVQTAPPHQKVMLALARNGRRGLTRAEISGLCHLDNTVMDDLLDALVRAGEVAVFQMQDGHRVYKRLM